MGLNDSKENITNAKRPPTRILDAKESWQLKLVKMTYCLARDLFICFPPGFHFCFCFLRFAVVFVYAKEFSSFLLIFFFVVAAAIAFATWFVHRVFRQWFGIGCVSPKHIFRRFHAVQSNSSAQANVTENSWYLFIFNKNIRFITQGLALILGLLYGSFSLWRCCRCCRRYRIKILSGQIQCRTLIEFLLRHICARHFFISFPLFAVICTQFDIIASKRFSENCKEKSHRYPYKHTGTHSHTLIGLS